MISLVLLMTVALAAVWFLLHRHYRHHPDYNLANVIDRSFAAVTFPLRDGRRLSGREVTVLQKPGLYALHTSILVHEPGYDADGFWYCAGPDGHFWVAIAHQQRQWLLWKVAWVVRPLTPERVRSALQDNPAALQLAFGDVQIDRLMA